MAGKPYTLTPDGKRTCKMCGKIGTDDEFMWATKSKGIRRNVCINCSSVFYAEQYQKNADEKREYQRDRYANQTEEDRLAAADRRRDGGYPPRDSIYERCRKHHITVDFYYELLDAQNNQCPICERELTPDVIPCLDHDHACCNNSGGTSCGNCIRGVLCARCNKGLGVYEKFPVTMADYVERTSLSACA